VITSVIKYYVCNYKSQANINIFEVYGNKVIHLLTKFDWIKFERRRLHAVGFTEVS